MVKQVLKEVARLNRFPYQSVFKEFIDGNNPSSTQQLLLKILPPVP
jgi:hypothetical protein